jgi:hypothetical protein
MTTPDEYTLTIKYGKHTLFEGEVDTINCQLSREAITLEATRPRRPIEQSSAEYRLVRHDELGRPRYQLFSHDQPLGAEFSIMDGMSR